MLQLASTASVDVLSRVLMAVEDDATNIKGLRDLQRDLANL
jgi:hypothetical protein